MSDFMDMSLDDIINKNRRNFRFTSGRGRPRGGTIGRGAKFGRKYGREAGRPNPYSSLSLPKPYASSSNRETFHHSSQRTQILVSNLDSGVIDEDIQELFGDIGPLKKASVHYDKMGCSLGTADVIFESSEDAITAIELYNGEVLDGQPMQIEIAYAAADRPTSNIKTRLGNHPNFRGRRNWSHMVAASGSKLKNAAKALPTAEELDAELDDYIQNKK